MLRCASQSDRMFLQNCLKQKLTTTKIPNKNHLRDDDCKQSHVCWTAKPNSVYKASAELNNINAYDQISTEVWKLTEELKPRQCAASRWNAQNWWSKSFLDFVLWAYQVWCKARLSAFLTWPFQAPPINPKTTKPKEKQDEPKSLSKTIYIARHWLLCLGLSSSTILWMFHCIPWCQVFSFW